MTSYSSYSSTIIEIWIQIIDYNKSNYILPDLQICKRTEKGSMIRCLGHILKGFCKLCCNAHYGLCYIVLSCSSSLRILLSSVQVNVKWNLQSCTSGYLTVVPLEVAILVHCNFKIILCVFDHENEDEKMDVGR